jgi:FKBP-type peptidyl-prolyl cis-trans isomerase 2
VFKVDWAGVEPFVPDSLKPKSSVVDGARVLLNYIGWTDEGVFDASIPDWQSKGVSSESSFEGFDFKPLLFTFGKDRLVPGFERQIRNMKKGEMKVIVVAPEEAYGTDPSKHKLGNKTLNFKVRIESVS